MYWVVRKIRTDEIIFNQFKVVTFLFQFSFTTKVFKHNANGLRCLAFPYPPLLWRRRAGLFPSSWPGHRSERRNRERPMALAPASLSVSLIRYTRRLHTQQSYRGRSGIDYAFIVPWRKLHLRYANLTTFYGDSNHCWITRWLLMTFHKDVLRVSIIVK